MPDTMTYPANGDTANLLKRARALKARIDADQAELAMVTATLGSRVPTTGKHTVEGLGTFTVSENNTYDETLIREALSPGQVKRCSVSKLDKGAVKRLYPDVYAAAKRHVGRKVSIG